MTTVHPEQLADEAIEARATWIERTLTRHHIPTNPTIAAAVDHLDRARTIASGTWRSTHPALAQLADDRLASISHLAAQGLVPDHGCTATAGRVTLEAVRDVHPVAHRYAVIRGREQVGTAWLNEAGPHAVAVGSALRSARHLADALELMARTLASAPMVGAS